MNFFRSLISRRFAGSQIDFHCYVCGGCEYYVSQVIWRELIREWQLSPSEAEAVNLQQGMKCNTCHTHMRGNVLALAILNCLESDACSLAELINNNNEEIRNVKILEINEAGNLGSYLSQFAHHQRADYPTVDMHNLGSISKQYDLIIHSDTLEHISNPSHALSECKSILAGNSYLIYTVPVVPGRMTRDRSGLPSSSHSRDSRVDYHVATEFGAEFWRYPIEAGFQNIRLFSLHYPVALAIAARK